jgi:type IV pilus assembly protein PilM
MIVLRRAEHLPIGVDLGQDGVKLVQLRQHKQILSVLHMHHAPVHQAPVPGVNDETNEQQRIDASIDVLQKTVRQFDYKGRHLAVTVPRHLVQLKTLRMPVLADDATLFGADAQTLSIRFIPVGEVRQGNDTRLEVIVLAVATSAIELLLQRYERSGFIVSSIDFEPCAIHRGVSRFVRRKDDEHEVNVLIDIGCRQSQVIIGRGNGVTFYKTLDMGTAALDGCVARKLGLDIHDATSLRRRYADGKTDENDPIYAAVVDATRRHLTDLAREVSLCLRYYSVTFRGQRPTRVRLLGGGAGDMTLRQAFAGALSVPVECYDPFVGVQSVPQTSIASGAWGVAFGAALRHAGQSLQREISTTARRRSTDVSMVEVVDLQTMAASHAEVARA